MSTKSAKDHYGKLNELMYNKLEKDECDTILDEMFWYEVLDRTVRWILGMDDKKITKDAILEIAQHYINDPETLGDAMDLSDCFEETSW